MYLLAFFIFSFVFLFFLSTKITGVVSAFIYKITKSKKWTVYFFALLFLPGTFLHEMAHFLAAVITFVPVGEIEFMPVVKDGRIKLGSVAIAQTDPLRRAFIGVAPVILGLSIIFLVLLKGNLFPFPDPWKTLIIGYIIFEVGNTMFASKKDMEGSLLVTIFFLLLYGAATFFGFNGQQTLSLFLENTLVISFLMKALFFLFVTISIDLIVLFVFWAALAVKPKVFVVFLLFLSIFLVYKTSASAHSSGPPFLKINGKFTADNPYFQGGSYLIDIAQETAPESYVVNNPITFEVDKKQLLFSPEVVDKATFKFTFSEDKKNQKEGLTLSHTFTKPRSYIISIEAKIPGEPYVLLDTVQLNILPSKEYKLPKTDIVVGTEKNNKQIGAKAIVSKDSSSAIKEQIWDIGDLAENPKEGEKVCFNIGKNFLTEVYYRVIDQNGFFTDSGFSITNMDGNIEVNGPGYAVKKPKVVKLSDIGCGSVLQFLPIIGIGVFTAIAIAFFIASQRRAKE